MTSEIQTGVSASGNNLSSPLLILCMLLGLGAADTVLGFLHWQSFLILIALAIGLFAFWLGPAWRAVVWLPLVVLGFVSALYRPEGFSYPVWFDLPQLHTGGKPFTYTPNLTKALAGFMVLAALLPFARAIAQRESPQWQARIRMNRALQICMACACVFLIVLNAWLVLGLDWHPKMGSFVLLFLVGNLLTTCVAEEAFMRLLMHEPIRAALLKVTKHKLSSWVADGLVLVFLTLLFLVTHSLSSGALYWVFGVAGFIYGLVYVLTRNIWLTIAVHFGVNAVHFGFLTYPL